MFLFGRKKMKFEKLFVAQAYGDRTVNKCNNQTKRYSRLNVQPRTRAVKISVYRRIFNMWRVFRTLTQPVPYKYVCIRKSTE